MRGRKNECFGSPQRITNPKCTGKTLPTGVGLIDLAYMVRVAREIEGRTCIPACAPATFFDALEVADGLPEAAPCISAGRSLTCQSWRRCQCD